MPNHLNEPTSASTKNEEVSRVGILFQLLLHHQRQRWKATSHIGVARRQPHADARRKRDHARLRAEMMHTTRSASAQPCTRTRSPPLSSISIIPDLPGDLRRRTARSASGQAGSSLISTGAKVSAGATVGSHLLSVACPFASIWRRQPNN